MTTLWTALIAAIALAGLAYWAWLVVCIARTTRTVPRLGNQNPPQPQTWPRLSVVIPACNEADTIASAARTLLAQDYPDLQIVLVDDRSEDGTGEIIDELASADPRVTAVHVAELPDGWLGKVHALHTGLARADGQFVLFTDADVHYSPGMLRAAVAHAAHRQLDHLAAFPKVWPAGSLLDAAIWVFVRHFVVFLARPWAVADPHSRAYTGIGAFNLVRREAFEKTEGFAWLRMEVADDMGVGLMMKRSGARCGVVSAFAGLGLHWHRSLGEITRCGERSFATASRFSLARTLVMGLVSGLLELTPLLGPLAMLWEPTRWVGLASLATTGLWVASSVQLARWTRGRIAAGLLGPVGAVILVAIFYRAAWLGRLRGGVMWRGTLYPSAELRKGMRVRFP